MAVTGLVGGCRSARVGLVGAALAAVLGATAMGAVPAARAQAAPVAISGLNLPTAVEILPSGRVYVAEKDGVIRTYDDLGGAGGRVALDLRDQISSFGDFGLTALAHRDGWLYGAYTPDTVFHDGCDDYGLVGDRPVSEVQGCPSSGRVARWPIAEDGSLGAEEVVLGGVDVYCFQFTAHGMGDLKVGPDGALYVSAGDGASFMTADYGQFGSNVCGDPPSMGGAFRAQTDADLGGKVIRLDPVTGARTTVASGLRNPFRLAFLGTQLYVTDTGWYAHEEINRIDVASPDNHGWPCYEGRLPRDEYTALGSPLCDALRGTTADPVFSYPHNSSGLASISALEGLEGALYFGDYTLRTLSRVAPDGTGEQLVRSGVTPVDLARTPDGELVLVDIIAGTVELVDRSAIPPAPPSVEPTVDVVLPAGPVAPGATVVFSLITDIRSELTVTWSVALLTGCAMPGPDCARAALPFDGQGAGEGTVTVPATATASGAASGGFLQIGVEVRNAVGARATDIGTVPVDDDGLGAPVPPGPPTDPQIPPPPGQEPVREVSRLAGGDRIATAASASASAYPGGAAVAYVARGDDFPDALAAGPLAAASGGPILLTGAGGLAPQTAAELERLDPARVVVLGGPAAVPASVEAELAARHPQVERLAGADRIATAVAIAERLGAVDRVYVASAERFPDALVGGVAAGLDGGVVLLTGRDALPAQVAALIARLAPDQVTVVGGDAAVGPAVAAALSELAPTRRVAGATRYGTAAALSAALLPGGAAAAYVATGEDFPDALGIAPTAIRARGALLLTQRSSLPSETGAELGRLAAQRVILAGGPAAIGVEVEAAVGG